MKTIRKVLGGSLCKSSLVFAALIVTLPLTFGAETRTSVIPPRYENASGEGNALIMEEGLRYMGVYSPAEFGNAMPEGGSITAIRFRLNEQIFGGPRRFDLRDVEVRMSTIAPITQPPGSHTFDDYVGIDEEVVFRGSLLWETEILPGGINPFDLNINLQQRFDYDPRFESLVIDIRTHDANLINTVRVDAMGPESSSFSISGPLSQPDAALFYFDPPILKIDFVPVPEPRAGFLFILALLLFKMKEH